MTNQTNNNNTDSSVRQIKCLITKVVGTMSVKSDEVLTTTEIYPHVGCVVKIDDNFMLLKNEEFEYLS